MQEKISNAFIYSYAGSMIASKGKIAPTPPNLMYIGAEGGVEKNKFVLVTRDVKVILKLLSILGVCPVDFSGLNEGVYRRLGWGPLSILSRFVIIAGAVNWVIFFCALGLRIPLITTGRFGAFHDFLASQLNENATDCGGGSREIGKTFSFVTMTLPAAQVISILSEWLHVRHLLRFLQGWDLFHNRVMQTFLCTEFASHPELRDESIPWWQKIALLTLMLGIPFCWLILISNAFSFGEFTQWSFFKSYDFFMVLVVGLHFVWVEAGLDLKCIGLFKSIRMGFMSIRMGIEESLIWQPATCAQVQKWRVLIMMVRAQTLLASKHIEMSQAALVLQAVIFSTAGIFLAMKMSLINEQMSLLSVVWVAFAFFLQVRLFIKTYKAEEIRRAESEIANILSRINVEELDEATEIQINITRNVMEMNPIRIELGWAKSFDRTIVLKIFHHVVTYVVVLMQSAQS